MSDGTEGLMLPIERYLESGIHIGTKLKNADTSKYIYKKRNDGIYILSIEKIDEGIRNALNELKKHNLAGITIVATRAYAENAAKKAKKFLPELDIITKRFIPGTFTNPESKHFREPEIVVVCDPRSEKEALREAEMMRIPSIALVDTDNTERGVDLPVPMNNKGRKSLALFFWILTRELLLKEGKIKSYDEFKVAPSYFEKLELEEE